MSSATLCGFGEASNLRLGQLRRKSWHSSDHLPPTSQANTTKRERPNRPANSGYVESIQRKRFTKPRQPSIREKKGPSLGKINVKGPQRRSPHVLKFEDKSHEETERQQRCARSKAWNLAENIYKLFRGGMCTPGCVKKRAEKKKSVVDTRANMPLDKSRLTSLSRALRVASSKCACVSLSFFHGDCALTGD